ncbi:MAG: cysteine hydrolase family protein [Gemmatimonadota bacterium]
MTGAPDGGVRQAPAIGWIVDVQNDFMRPPDRGGRLYVRDLFDPSDQGATLARAGIERAVRWMADHCDALVFTGDWHGLDDAEIDPVAPDPAAGTYPPHCMGRSEDPAEREGAEILESIRPRNPVVLEPDASADDASRAARAALAEGRPLFVRKTRFDVFAGNAGSEALLTALREELGGWPPVYVAGVARDVCVTQAIDGMQARGYRTVAIRDATWGLGLEPEEETLARWARGGEVVTLAELEAAAPPRTTPR